MVHFRLAALVAVASALPAQNLFNSISIHALEMSAGANPTFIAGTSDGIFLSRDERQSWTPIDLSADPSGRQPAIGQIERDRNDAQVFYAAGSGLFATAARPQGPEFFRSNDAGSIWTPKTSGLPADGDLRQIHVTAAGNYAVVRVGADRRVYRSTNRGDSWTLFRTLPTNANRVVVHPTNTNLWYYESGRAIFRSTDEGATWTSAGPFPIRAANLGIENSVSAIVANPDNDSILLVATGGPVFGGDEFNNGLFFSDNRGASWQRKTNSTSQQMVFQEGVFIAHQVESRSVWISVDGGRNLREPVRMGSAPSGRADGFLVDRRQPATIYSGLLLSPNQGRTWEGLEATVTPFIGVDPGDIELSGSTRDQAPLVQPFVVAAQGATAWRLAFTVESSAPWLTVSNTQGNTRAALQVRALPGGLPVGVHEGTLTVRSTEAANESAVAAVRLTVTDAPAVERSPTILTFAGDGTFGTRGDGGPAVEASLEGPTFMTFSAQGGLLISDRFADRVRYVDPEGQISTFAGSGAGEFSGDGGPARQAGIDSPRGLAVGAMGEVYICDGFNRRIRVVAPSGTISTFAGNGEFGTNAATGRVEDLRLSPNDIVAAPDGALYLTGSGTFRVNPDGTYTRWSSTSYNALALSPEGRLYGLTATRVLELRPNNFTLPFAGVGETGFSGDGGPALEARLNGASDMAFDRDGRLFIADTNNHVVRVVDLDRTIRSYAGTGVSGDSGDGGPANLAQLTSPSGVLAGPDGRLYISGGRKVRVVLPPGSAGPAPQLTSAGIVTAASFGNSVVAPAQMVSIFGANLSPELAVATSTPLPETLAGVRAELIGADGAARPLPLIFVAPNQINALIPQDAPLGAARLRVVGADGQAGEAPVQVSRVAPGLFAANARGQGLAAATVVRVSADGSQTPLGTVAGSDPAVSVPIDLGSPDDLTVLLLFGTGIRGFQNAVEVTIGGEAATVLGVAPQSEFAGLDQVNVLIPRSLAGRGEVDVRVVVDGLEANVVRIAVR